MRKPRRFSAKLQKGQLFLPTKKVAKKTRRNRDKSFKAVFPEKIIHTFIYLSMLFGVYAGIWAHCFSNRFTVNTSRARSFLTCEFCRLGVPFSTFSRELSLVSSFPGCLGQIKDGVVCMQHI